MWVEKSHNLYLARCRQFWYFVDQQTSNTILVNLIWNMGGWSGQNVNQTLIKIIYKFTTGKCIHSIRQLGRTRMHDKTRIEMSQFSLIYKDKRRNSWQSQKIFCKMLIKSWWCSVCKRVTWKSANIFMLRKFSFEISDSRLCCRKC